jgi:hypothetical protein
MAKQITITNIVGTEPYNIYLCDNLYNNCIYIATISNIDIPYNFIVPTAFEALSTVGVKIIDANNCEIKDTITI